MRGKDRAHHFSPQNFWFSFQLYLILRIYRSFSPEQAFPPKSLCPGSRQRTSRCKTQENLGLWTILLPLTSHFTLIQTLGVTLIQLSAWEECPLHLESSHPHVCSLQKKKEKKNFPGLPHAQINGKIGCLPPNLQDL